MSAPFTASAKFAYKPAVAAFVSYASFALLFSRMPWTVSSLSEATSQLFPQTHDCISLRGTIIVAPFPTEVHPPLLPKVQALTNQGSKVVFFLYEPR